MLRLNEIEELAEVEASAEVEELNVDNGLDTPPLSPEEAGEVNFPTQCCTDHLLQCPFARLCSIGVRVRHRNLILGEPLTYVSMGASDPQIVELLKSWKEIDIMKLLDIALPVMLEMDTPDYYRNKTLPYSEKHLYTGVALLRLHIQLNYTGPSIMNTEIHDKLDLFKVKNMSPEKKTIFAEALQIDGIGPDELFEAPVLVLLANYFLSTLRTEPTLWPFYVIWRFRADFLLQLMLDRRSATLSQRLKFLADQYLTWMKCPNHALTGSFAQINLTMVCEIAEMLAFYYDGLLSERFITQAKSMIGMTLKFTGKLGYRTKHQQVPTPQIVLDVDVDPPEKLEEDRVFTGYDINRAYLPNSCSLDDDTRRDRILLVDEHKEFQCSAIQQFVVLAAMSHKAGYGGTTKLELERFEEEALIQNVLDQPLIWSGRVAALVRRCRLEQNDKRAMNRALRQVQEIVTVILREGPTEGTLERQHLFFGSGCPSMVELKFLIGDILLTHEYWKEAVVFFKQLNDFEKLVTCYVKMGKRDEAETLVRQKIEDEGETQKLLLLLGDVTSDISMYEKAWEISGEKNVESQKRLGFYHFERTEFVSAIIYLKRVVELAPLEYPCWVRLAWCCYKTEDYENAFHAYLYAANMEYDNFQVWNNLGNCAVRLNRKEYALRAYNVAVKCNYDEWRVWQNILTLASELEKVNDSVFAYHRILDYNRGFCDEISLELIVNTVRNKLDVSAIGSVAKLMGRISSTTAKNSRVFLLYGRLLTSYVSCNIEEEKKCTEFERGLHFYEKALTLILQDPMWRSEFQKLNEVVSYIIEFRQERERNASDMNYSSVDRTLKQAAKTVEKGIKSLDTGAPNPRLEEISDKLKEEISLAFYAM